MSLKKSIIFGSIFAFFGVISNILVQYTIVDLTTSFSLPIVITWGALTYPITYLLSDILSEKHGKDSTLLAVRLGAVLNIIPSFYLADFRIALASSLAFFIMQNFDVYLFHYIKEKFPKLWWFRNNASTMTSQLFDSTIFFVIAFYGTMDNALLLSFILGDYAIKVVTAILDTPFFYFFAIRKKKVPKAINY